MNYPQQPGRPGQQPDPYGRQQYGTPPYGQHGGGYEQGGHQQGGSHRRGPQQGGYDQPRPPRTDHEQAYDQRGYDEPPPARARRTAAPPKRRRVWPWIVLAAILVPVLGFVGCTALVAGGVSAVQEQRAGGTLAIGETFSYADGLAITVAAPTPYQAENEFEIGDGEQGHEALITVVNGTDSPVGAVLITKNATVNGQPAQEVFGTATFATQDIAPGQQLVLPFRFKVAEGTTGPLQIAVTGAFNEPAFFTGQLG